MGSVAGCNSDSRWAHKIRSSASSTPSLQKLQARDILPCSHGMAALYQTGTQSSGKGFISIRPVMVGPTDTDVTMQEISIRVEDTLACTMLMASTVCGLRAPSR